MWQVHSSVVTVGEPRAPVRGWVRGVGILLSWGGAACHVHVLMAREPAERAGHIQLTQHTEAAPVCCRLSAQTTTVHRFNAFKDL